MKLKDFGEFESMAYSDEMREEYVNAKRDAFDAVDAACGDDVKGFLDAMFGGMARSMDRAIDFKLRAYHEWLSEQLRDR